MKLLTLNTHSLIETEYEKKLLAFAEVVLREKPDVMALQEVNQTMVAEPVPMDRLKNSGYVPCSVREDMEPAVIREDNHAYRLAKLLAERGLPFSWTWVAAKIGYDKYDEGLALFTVWPVEETDQFFLSGSHDYKNWKTRRALGIKAALPSGSQWFASVHMGWWKDEEEPFRQQYERLEDSITTFWGGKENVWLMGDFNSRADVRGEGYDLVKAAGWHDTYETAERKDDGYTAAGEIDGWKNGEAVSGMRIDYIWCGKAVKAEESRVICSGRRESVVSDHFGIVILLNGMQREE